MNAPVEQDAKEVRAELESALLNEKQLVIALRGGDWVRGRITAILGAEVWIEKGPRLPLADIESVRGLR